MYDISYISALSLSINESSFVFVAITSLFSFFFRSPSLDDIKKRTVGVIELLSKTNTLFVFAFIMFTTVLESNADVDGKKKTVYLLNFSQSVLNKYVFPLNLLPLIIVQTDSVLSIDA